MKLVVFTSSDCCFGLIVSGLVDFKGVWSGLWKILSLDQLKRLKLVNKRWG